MNRRPRPTYRIGQRFQARRDRDVVTVRQLHRADRVAEIVDANGRRTQVAFRDLQRNYLEVPA